MTVRVLVGESVYEDAEVTYNEGTLYVEFHAEDLDDLAIPLADRDIPVVAGWPCRMPPARRDNAERGQPQMATPNGTVVTAKATDGTTTDVTEGVKALYDLVLSSMDWGSGFLTVEDAAPVGFIAEVCGFDADEEIARYLRERQKDARLKELERQGVIWETRWAQVQQEFEEGNLR